MYKTANNYIWRLTSSRRPKTTKAQARAGHKWSATQAKTIICQRQQEIVGLLQSGRASFGWGKSTQDVVHSD